jgi:hypothetical protein
MKAYLGLRDTERIYATETDGDATGLFGIDRRERNFARIHLA